MGCFEVCCVDVYGYTVFVYGVDGVSALDFCEGLLGIGAVMRVVRVVAGICTC